MNQSHYEVISSPLELKKFIDWLPDLEPGEAFYTTLLARNKYVKELGLGTFNSDRHQCARFLIKKDRLYNKIWSTEAPLGSYVVKGTVVPQAALACYINPNPRGLVRAQPDIIQRLVRNVMLSHKDARVDEDVMTAIHKTIGRKIYMDFDIDGEFNLNELAKNVATCVNPEAVSIVITRGGYHILVKVAEIKDEYRRTWYHRLRALVGVDVVGDTLLPIPGTYQGGFTPRLHALNELL